MPKKYLNDYEIMYLISLGDDDALEQLIAKYKRLMTRSLQEYKSILYEKFDQHELFQIALLALYQAILTYNEKNDCSFFTYLRVIVHRGELAYIRKLNRDRSRANLYTISLDQIVKEKDGIYLVDMVENNQSLFNPEDLIRYKELCRVLLTNLAQHSKKEQMVFLMWLQGYAYEEISNHNGVTCHQVSYIVGKIKKKLQGLIDYKGAL